jgi:hypothetical protein
VTDAFWFISLCAISLCLFILEGCSTKSPDPQLVFNSSSQQDILILLDAGGGAGHIVQVNSDSLTFRITEIPPNSSGGALDSALHSQILYYRSVIDSLKRKALGILQYSQIQIDSLLSFPDYFSTNSSTTCALSLRSSSLRNARLIDLATFRSYALDSLLPNHDVDDLTSWAWSSDGKYLALACGRMLIGRNLVLLSLPSLKILHDLRLPNQVDDVIWTPDSKSLLVVNESTELWKNPPIDLLFFLIAHPNWYGTFHISKFDLGFHPMKDTTLAKNLINVQGVIFPPSH